jgi:hypothetical protein
MSTVAAIDAGRDELLSGTLAGRLLQPGDPDNLFHLNHNIEPAT